MTWFVCLVQVSSFSSLYWFRQSSSPVGLSKSLHFLLLWVPPPDECWRMNLSARNYKSRRFLMVVALNYSPTTNNSLLNCTSLSLSIQCCMTPLDFTIIVFAHCSSSAPGVSGTEFYPRTIYHSLWITSFRGWMDCSRCVPTAIFHFRFH